MIPGTQEQSSHDSDPEIQLYAEKQLLGKLADL